MKVFQKIYGEKAEGTETIEWQVVKSPNNGLLLQARNPRDASWHNILWMKDDGDLIRCDGAKAVAGIETQDESWRPLIKN